MKYIIALCFITGISLWITGCEEKDFKFVLGEDNEYTFDLSGSADFTEFHIVTSDDLIDITEDLDDEVRENAHQLEIEYVKANVLANTGNTTTSIKLTVSIDWNMDSTDIDILFTNLTVPVINDGKDYFLITDLTEQTIDLLNEKFFDAVRLTDVTPFRIWATGTMDNGNLDALLTVIIKISAVSSIRDEFPNLILND
jgi:hypothetical protein